MTKNQLRIETIEQLKKLRPKVKQEIERKLFHYLFESRLWKDAHVIGVTWSQDIEWDTKPIIKQAWKENKIVSLPKSDPNTKQMIFYTIDTENDLQLGYANILEPRDVTHKIPENEIDLLIVPGVVFDLSGYRIGFGGGFYDRFLIDFNQKTLSLCSKKQIVKKIPINSHDIPVQYLITEDGCFQTKS